MKQGGEIPEEYREAWDRSHDLIRERLGEFAEVPQEEYFFELLYCLLTPQSRAANAEQVIAKLRAAGFPNRTVDPEPLLRDPAHYIRFHTTKAGRVLRVAEQWKEIERTLLDPALDNAARRRWLAAHVNGLGWKEASHFLRNIGARNLAIIDRHILVHMERCGALEGAPKLGGERAYLELERRFNALAERFGLEPQELDLLFWSMQEGSVRK